MKVIFLNIDGVLITDEFPYEPDNINPPPFNKECVRVFNEILSETNAIIILSSTWKKMWDLRRLDFIFKFNGVIKSPLDVTADLGNREKEITDYVQQKAITDFVILDDMQLAIFPGQFVQCKMEHGLKQEGIKEKIITILKRSLDPLQVR